MRVKNQLISWFLIFLAGNNFIFCSDNGPKEKLILANTFPKEEIYFKAVPPIDIDEAGNIYAVGNREQMVFKFNPEGKLLLSFGGYGQGPGELEWPYYFDVNEHIGKVFILDDAGLSLFSEDGKFINRFRVFSPALSVSAALNRIYLLQPTENNLIHEYSYEGKYINSFGDKYRVDYSIYKNMSPRVVDRLINEGSVLSNGDIVFYVSYLIGDICKYNSRGEKLGSRRLSELRGKARNEKIIYHQGLSRNINGTIPIPPRIIQAAQLSGGRLFLLITGYGVYGETEPLSHYEIWRLSVNSLRTELIYVLDLKEIEIEHFCVLSRGNEDTFFISLYDNNQEKNLIGLLKKEGSR
ncbi:MAG: hypothetical protein N3G18_04490 [Candidatus Saccharicenans sp.]|nr:hypothetical protein [Candidatus Saccharicenans sp.]